MKKLAKLTSLLLAGIMALALLTACNGTPGAAEAEALGKQYTAQALAILNEYRATQNTEQTPYPQLDNDPELLALAEQRLAELNTTKVFCGEIPLASQKMLKITKVAFAYRVVGGKAYVAMAFVAPKK